jgi:hypothetical protein
MSSPRNLHADVNDSIASISFKSKEKEEWFVRRRKEDIAMKSFTSSRFLPTRLTKSSTNEVIDGPDGSLETGEHENRLGHSYPPNRARNKQEQIISDNLARYAQVPVSAIFK